jgi:hypothetical protein
MGCPTTPAPADGWGCTRLSKDSTNYNEVGHGLGRRLEVKSMLRRLVIHKLMEKGCEDTFFFHGR